MCLQQIFSDLCKFLPVAYMIDYTDILMVLLSQGSIRKARKLRTSLRVKKNKKDHTLLAEIEASRCATWKLVGSSFM